MRITSGWPVTRAEHVTRERSREQMFRPARIFPWSKEKDSEGYSNESRIWRDCFPGGFGTDNPGPEPVNTGASIQRQANRIQSNFDAHGTHPPATKCPRLERQDH